MNAAQKEIEQTKRIIPQKTQDELINKLDIKEYIMKNSFKSRKIYYSEDLKEEVLLDKLAQEKQNEHCIYQAEIDSQMHQFTKNIISNYLDHIFIDKEEKNVAQYRKTIVTHILQHVKNYEQNLEKQEDPDNEENIIKKGYTKPTILIITPYKGDANMIIQEIINQYTGKQDLKKITNKQKFQEQFENEENFAEDDFRIGITIGMNKKVKLFSPFQYSDIIVSSPLGLRLNLMDKESGNSNFSHLSSIEICYIDRASTILMQNWEHLEQIFEKINKIPKHQDMTSGLNEIRQYYFDNLQRFFRQTIIYSEFNFPELNSFRNRQMNNYEGSIQNKPFYEFNYENNSLFSQEFVKIEINDFNNEVEERFLYFKSKIWENWRNIQQCVIFCSSYYDYLKLKNYFTRINCQFQCISEYTPKKKIQQRISLLMKKSIKFILFSERAYYFDLCQIRKMKHVLFYQLPKNDFIYHKMISDIQDRSQKTKIQALFTKYDSTQIERIVGTENSQKFLADYNKSTNFIL